MKKLTLIFFIVMGCVMSAKADHITGGEMYYTLASVQNGVYRYNFTLKLFMRCNSGRQFSNPNIISIFNRSTNSRVTDISVPLSNTETIGLANPSPCITSPPTVCYVIGYYHFELALPSTPAGYIVTAQVNYRINNITNLTGGYANVGATYTAEIPGTGQGSTAMLNSSANFVDDDLVIVCANNSFQYNFAAVDPDKDQLEYSFCNAYQTQTSGNGAPPSAPPYESIPYGNGFSGSGPLGNQVKINPGTGQITGTAPASGIYVVTVCVQEKRGGVVIATQRKDLQIFIAPCTIAAATLPDEYMLCDTSRTIFLQNHSTSPLINSYYWELKSMSGQIVYTSSSATTNFTFRDTGVYYVKLVVNRGQECSDSTVSLARVFPGFKPDFDISGFCFSKPSFFTDRTITAYGRVQSWNWDFGEPGSLSDISTLQNPSFTFPSTGLKNVTLVVTNTKGCRDTLTRNVDIFAKPPIQLGFRDTLICIPDPVQLQASGSGRFSWKPSSGMSNANTGTPVVAPVSTTTYYVELNDNGCINTDSVKVRVVDHVDLQVMNDTTVCASDTIRLGIASNAFQYSWTPANQLIDPNAKNPLAITTNTTTYQIIARIGSCRANGQLVVKTVPYPVANAGPDTTICFGTSTRLNGFTDGSSYSWSQDNSISNTTILNPVVHPEGSTAYILSCTDTRGCPKPSRDTVLVNVLPDILASAGRDTTVVIGQALQLQATGGTRYTWSPSTGLSSSTVSNPTAVYNNSVEQIRYRVMVYNEEGCVDSSFVNVKVYKTRPTVFVPTAFTPNGDGRNDRLTAVAVGIRHIEYFQIYNRWGQLVYQAGLNGQGWDGKINGQIQAPSTYVWVVKGIDYTGASFFQKGLTTLIR